MNTPAHLVANLLALSHRERPREVVPITVGALLPDAPMFVFYAWEKLIRHTPEMTIWRERYFDHGWQTFFDVFNSLPLIALAMLVAHFIGSRGALVLFGSMGIHALLDLPLHREDAHRHFWPLFDWHFESPVSYWHPDHFGAWVSLAEIALTVGGVVLLWRRHPQRWIRVLAATLGGLYALYWGFVVVVWL